MKKITLFAAAFTFVGSLNAQIYSDDFESYNAGSGIAAQSTQWVVWPAAGAQDVNVVDDNANSGSNALYFEGIGQGGPQDVLMNLDQQYTDGIVTIDASLYVLDGASAYFNLQATPQAGITWAMDCFVENGKLRIQNAANVTLTTPVASDTWVDLKLVSNLSTGIWAAFVDNNLVGHWVNETNTLASVNFYPVSGNQYYVDDVAFDFTAYTADALNASVAELGFSGNVAGQNAVPTLNVVNTGTTTITSFDVQMVYNGQTLTETVTGVSLDAGDNLEVPFPAQVLFAGVLEATASITAVNGGVDDNLTDNATRIVVSPIIPAIGKIVVGEEGTGTWCQWCPRGDVFMNQFAQDYDGLWAGIAVHNGDPMDFGTYDSILGYTGYPGAFVDRGDVTDPSTMQGQFETRIETAPTAFIDMGANWNANSRILNLSVTADFQMAANSDYKLAVIVTEDGVTGTGSQWSQSNAYSGGANGTMGGYENLPNPVPAAQMVYNHVARGVAPAVEGFDNSFPATVAVGASHNVTFELEFPDFIDINNCHIVAILIAPDGSIDNAGYATFDEAVTEDYDPSGNSAGYHLLNVNEATTALGPNFKVYPNPASNEVNIRVNLETAGEVAIEIMDLNGKTIDARAYGSIQGMWDLPYAANTLKPGIYLVKVSVDGVANTKRLIIQ